MRNIGDFCLELRAIYILALVAIHAVKTDWVKVGIERLVRIIPPSFFSFDVACLVRLDSRVLKIIVDILVSPVSEQV
jgi:hypothetical protein